MATSFQALLLLFALLSNAICSRYIRTNALIRREHHLHHSSNRYDDYTYNPYRRRPHRIYYRQQYYLRPLYSPRYAARLYYADTNDLPSNDTQTANGAVYSDRAQSTALFFSICLGMLGIDRYYIGDDVLGSAKLGLFISIVVAPLLLVCCFGTAWVRGQDDGDAALSMSSAIIGWSAVAIFVLAASALLIWVIADIIRFAMNDIVDADGLTLEPM